MNRLQLINAPKELKEFTFEEFKSFFRGARFKTREDWIKGRHWLQSKDKDWYFYWQRGIDGRQTP